MTFGSEFQDLGYNTRQSELNKSLWDEVREINRTASEVNDKTFVFAIELHKPRNDVVQAHLRRAYVCPPDQIQEAMDADRVH